MFISLHELTLWLLVAGSALYIQLPVVGKPYFALTGMAVCVFIAALIGQRSITITALAVVGCSALLILIMAGKMVQSADPFEHLYVLNMLLLPLSYLAVVGMRNPSRAIRYFKFGIHLTFAVLAVELVYRLLNPSFGGRVVDPSEIEGGTFYLFKISSLMYTNSNGVGMHALFLLAFVFALYGQCTPRNTDMLAKGGLTRKFFWYSYLGALLYTVGSLSRAAIVVFLLLSSLYFVLSNVIRLRFALVFALLVSVPATFVAVPIIIELFAGDASFWTKFDILMNLMRYLRDATVVQMLFGNNLDYPTTIYEGFVGYFGHAHYFDIIFRLGFIFGALYLSLLLFVLVNLRWRGVLFVLCFVILGLSNIRIFGHYLFLYMGLALSIPVVNKSLESKYTEKILPGSACLGRAQLS